MAKNELTEHRIQVCVTLSQLKKITRLAKRNGRSLSGEARFALASYTEKNHA